MAKAYSTPNTKTCTACKQSLDAASFHRNRSKPDGLATECKECARVKARNHYLANREAQKLIRQEHYRNNSESYKRRARNWEREHSDRKKELRAIYREKYRERIKLVSKRDWQRHNAKRLARKKQYRRENRDKCAAQYKKYMAQRERALPPWARLEKIRWFYTEARYLTNATGILHHVDHIVPLHSDVVCGLHNEFNLQVVTAFENQSKGNQHTI